MVPSSGSVTENLNFGKGRAARAASWSSASRRVDIELRTRCWVSGQSHRFDAVVVTPDYKPVEAGCRAAKMARTRPERADRSNADLGFCPQYMGQPPAPSTCKVCRCLA